MGNKNAIPPKGPNPGTAQKEEDAGSVSREQEPGPGPELLASLQSLRENSDSTLLPLSLHQIAEAYSLKEDYQWAIQFLQLEKLYHERLLSNLAALQEDWESQWRQRKNDEDLLPPETDGISQSHMETLSQICRTHQRPSVSTQQRALNAALQDVQSDMQQHRHGGATHQDEEFPLPQAGRQDEEETYEEGQEVEEEEEEEELCEETPEEEVKVEWPAGVPQASDKDLAKLSHTEGSSAPDGLVSILKRRRASLDGLPPPSTSSTSTTTHHNKRRVRFSEPEDGTEPEEVSGDSCLILLLLCLVTVVISVGGTAFYCTLVDTYSNICTDFSHNVDFYVGNVRRFFEGLGRWLPLRT